MLKSSYDSKDDIPEGAQDHYQEQSDGSYKLQLKDGTKTKADVQRVKSALDKEKDIRKEQDSVLKELDIKVYDDGSYDEQKVEELKNPSTGSNNDLDEEEIREDERQKWREEKEELVNERQAAIEKGKNDFRNRRIKEALAKQGFENVDMLENFLLLSQNRDTEDYNEVRRHLSTVEVKETENGYEIAGGSVGDKQGFQDAMEKISQLGISKHYQPGPDNKGGGSSNNGKSVTDDNPYDEEAYNLTEQAKLEDQNPERAKQLANEAGVELNLNGN